MSLDRILHVPDSYRASGNAGKYLVTRGIVRICYCSCSTATSLYLKHYFVFEFVVMSGSQQSRGRPWSSKITPVDQAPPPHTQTVCFATSRTDKPDRQRGQRGTNQWSSLSFTVLCNGDMYVTMYF